MAKKYQKSQRQRRSPPVRKKAFLLILLHFIAQKAQNRRYKPTFPSGGLRRVCVAKKLLPSLCSVGRLFATYAGFGVTRRKLVFLLNFFKLIGWSVTPVNNMLMGKKTVKVVENVHPFAGKGFVYQIYQSFF